MERVKSILIAIFGVAIILLLLGKCSDNRAFDKERQSYILNDSINQKLLQISYDENDRERRKYMIEELNFNQVSASNDRELGKLKKDLADMGVKLKNVKSITRAETTTAGTVLVAVHDTIPCDGTDDYKIKKPFVYGDKWLDIKGETQFSKIGKNVVIDTVSIKYEVRNNLTMAYAYDRNWFLGKKYLSLTITNDNPNTKVGKVQTYVIKNEKRFYEKWWFQAAIGVGTGWYLHEKL